MSTDEHNSRIPEPEKAPPEPEKAPEEQAREAADRPGFEGGVNFFDLHRALSGDDLEDV